VRRRPGQGARRLKRYALAGLALLALIGMVALDLIAACALEAAPAAAATAPADTSFLAQWAATYRFRLGRPTAVQVAPAGDAVLFLRSGPRSFVQDLISFDVASRRERVLLTAESVLRGADEKLSAAERARRERQRQTARGIASYQLSEDGRWILVPLASRLFVVERASGRVNEIAAAAGEVIDPQLSPDAARVAYVRDNDLYVAAVAGGPERRLTQGGSGAETHGVAEFVAQEEMDRFSGFWWSPDSRSLAYESADLSKVEELHIADPVHPERAAEAWRYPRVGTPNAEVRLGILPAAGGPTTWVEWDRARYPYLATVRWSKSAPLTALVQNRRQTEEVLLAVDEHTGKAAPLLIERDPAWLNLDQSMPTWLEDGSGFLWTTERRGAWQLELRGRDGKLQRALNAPELGLRHFAHLDDRARVAWVQASRDPAQLQLWKLPLDGRPPRPVTTETGIHGATFGRGHDVFVESFEGPASRVVQTVRGADGASIAELRSVAETPGLEAAPRFLEVRSRQPGATRAYAAVVLTPRDFDTARRYPVIVSVYGGPLSQTVLKSRDRYLLEQWIANQGFVVVSFDGRGTPGRGRAWERAIRHDLIDVPLDDQIDALQSLAHEMPALDLSRAGIYGWSFGGYFSAMAAMRRPEVFRAGVAGAPVADFRDYDTHYTERYLDLPELNPTGYRASSVLTYAPELRRPLLVIHGTADDNVYFLHSLKLCDALFRAGRDFEFLPLAGFTHMVPDPLVSTRLYGRIVEFLERNLKEGGGVP